LATNFVLGNRRKAVSGSSGDAEETGDGAMMTMIGRRSSRVLDADDVKIGDEEKEEIKAGMELKIEDEKRDEREEPKEAKEKEGERKSLRRRSLGRPTSSQIMAGDLDRERERVEKEKREKKELLLSRMGPHADDKGEDGLGDERDDSHGSPSDEPAPMRLGQAGKKKSASRMLVTQPLAKRKERSESDNEGGREMVADSPQRRERCVIRSFPDSSHS
jgi:hypothetical protein